MQYVDSLPRAAMAFAGELVLAMFGVQLGLQDDGDRHGAHEVVVRPRPPRVLARPHSERRAPMNSHARRKMPSPSFRTTRGYAAQSAAWIWKL